MQKGQNTGINNIKNCAGNKVHNFQLDICNLKSWTIQFLNSKYKKYNNNIVPRLYIFQEIITTAQCNTQCTIVHCPYSTIGMKPLIIIRHF